MRMNKYFRKMMALSGSVLMLGVTLTGCSLNKTDQYIAQLESIQCLNAYDYELNMDLDTVLDEVHVSGELTLEGEFVNNEWFYALVSYEGKELTEVMIRDNQVAVNLKMLYDNVGVLAEVLLGIGSMEEQLFAESDYVVVDFPTEGLLTQNTADGKSYNETMRKMVLESLKTILETYEKTALTKEEDTYRLVLGQEEIEAYVKDYCDRIEANEDYIVETMADMMDGMIQGLKSHGDIMLEAVLETIEEVDMTEIAEENLDGFIEQLELLEDMDVAYSEEITFKDGVYTMGLEIEAAYEEEDIQVEVTSEYKVTPKDKEIVYNYKGGKLPEGMMTVQDMVMRVEEQIGQGSVMPESATEEEAVPVVSDAVMAEREAEIQKDYDFLVSEGYEDVDLDYEWGCVSAEKIINPELYYYIEYYTSFDEETKEISSRRFEIELDPTLTEAETIATLKGLEAQIAGYLQTDIDVQLFEHVIKREGEDYYREYDAPVATYDIYEGDDYKAYSIRVYYY